MNETTERFLQEIATRVGHDRVAELYLFPVLRQGGVEGAVAVVAAYPEASEGVEVTETTQAFPGEAAEALEASGAGDDAAAAGEQVADESVGGNGPEGSADAPAEPDTEVPVESTRESANASRVRARHVVYTARYRHTIKGTDRGRWAVEVVAEADAPLITVEEVVRGVVRRSGDEFQPERISGEQFRALVRAPATAGSAPA